MASRTRSRSLAFRLVAGAGLWIIAALAIGGIVISTLFRDSVERNFDARLSVHVDSLIAVTTVDISKRLVISRTLPDPRFDIPYSGWYWQVSDPRGAPQVRSRSLWDKALVPPPPDAVGVMQTEEMEGPDGELLRIRFIDVTLPDLPVHSPPVRFAVAARVSELKAELRPFNLALVWSLGVLGLGLGVAVAIQVRVGLQPLRRIRAALNNIREGRAEHLEGEWPTEVQPLVKELDALLEHNADVLDRARTHVGNLAHALKTPLAVLTNEVSRKGGPRTGAIDRQVDAMHRWIDHYLARARAAATGTVLGARTAVPPVLDDLRRTLLRIHADKALTIDVAGGVGTAAFRGEQQDLEEMLGNLMDNACKWSATAVRLSVATEAGRLTITIDDDGPGLTPVQREEAVGRGKRLDESSPGSGLGLAIVSDIAALYGGELELKESPAGGLRAVLMLPAAAG
ncbi:MAG: ATP-binding protein [Proteobacteria bacterium]|nr:ATP-binding protein [Pseudomonadota bacterium]